MGIINSRMFTENSKLTHMDIERFKQLMLGDKVIIGCDEAISEINDESSLIECLVYMWQQQASDFRKKLPKEVKDWFITKFVPNDRSYYKGMHFKPNTDLDNLTLDSVEFTSVTTDYNVAVEFAYGYKDVFKNEGCICAIYEVDGTRVLRDIGTFREMEESESIIMNPSFKLLEVLN